MQLHAVMQCAHSVFQQLLHTVDTMAAWRLAHLIRRQAALQYQGRRYRLREKPSHSGVYFVNALLT